MREATKHREAFDLYWSLGADRSIERLHVALKPRARAPSLRSLYEWSRLFHWQARVARLEGEARREADEARIEDLRQMLERHAKEGLLLQQKGAEWITNVDEEHVTADTAIRAIAEGVRIERLARGEATDRQEVRGTVQVHARLEVLNDDELDRLIDYTEGLVGGAGATVPGRSLQLADGNADDRRGTA
jgi:hypothetical protein